MARTPNNNNLLDAEVVVPLKYFSNFGRYVDLSLISCEKELDLNLSLDLMFFFFKKQLTRRKDGAYLIKSMIKKIKEHIGFHHLLTET